MQQNISQTMCVIKIQLSDKISRGIVALLCCLILPAQIVIAAEQSLLWRIEKQGVAASYLFGTIHTDDERVLALPVKVQQAFDNSATVLLEIKMDLDTQLQVQQLLLRTDGSKLQDDIGSQRYQDVLTLLGQRNIPEMMVSYLQVWAATVLLLSPDNKSPIVLDYMLQQQASKRGKRVEGLETVASQLSRFSNLSLQQQIKMLDESIAVAPQLKELHAKLIQTYLQEDLAGLFKLSQIGFGDSELSDKLMTTLIDDRNHEMLQAALPYINKGSAFIAVGALHLPGKAGLIQLLKAQGFRVQAVIKVKR